MDKEYLDLLAEKFAKASAWRASKEDIDWKEIKYNTKSGKTVTVQLAYLNWAVAWRAMLEIYPDANFRIIEDALGNPVWNVNGFGFVKCAVSALGVLIVEHLCEGILVGDFDDVAPIPLVGVHLVGFH